MFVIGLFIISEFAVLGYLAFNEINLIIISFAFFISAIIMIFLIVGDMFILEMKYYNNVQKGHRVMKTNSKLTKCEK